MGWQQLVNTEGNAAVSRRCSASLQFALSHGEARDMGHGRCRRRWRLGRRLTHDRMCR